MPPRNKMIALAVPAALVAVIGAALADMRFEHWQRVQKAEALTGGNSNNGKILFRRYGCGTCHTIVGLPGAKGLVGPELDGTAFHAIIAGRLENNPANLERWIMDPQGVSPGTAMPNLGVTQEEARDIAAFLYTRP